MRRVPSAAKASGGVLVLAVHPVVTLLSNVGDWIRFFPPVSTPS